MRTSENKINPTLNRQIQKTFAQLIADIRSNEEALSLLESFFTPSEFETFSKRLAIAYWLNKGRSYTNIKQNLKVSSATIASVQQMSKSKAFQSLLKHIEADQWADKWSEKIKNFVGK